MQFLYLLPEEGTIEMLIQKYGLISRASENWTKRGCRIGLKADIPCLVGQGDREVDAVVLTLGESAGFYPDKQRWDRFALDVPEHWIGTYIDAQPDPKDLERDEMIAGHRVKLRDGNDWLVPSARSFAGGTSLPQDLMLGPDGKLVGEISAEYRGLFDRASDLAASVYRDYTEEEMAADTIIVEMEPEDMFRLAVDALAVNYRVSIEEVNHLRLLNSPAMHAVLRALVDFPTFVELAKELAAQDDRKKKIESTAIDADDVDSRQPPRLPADVG